MLLSFQRPSHLFGGFSSKRRAQNQTIPERTDEYSAGTPSSRTLAAGSRRPGSRVPPEDIGIRGNSVARLNSAPSRDASPAPRAANQTAFARGLDRAGGPDRLAVGVVQRSGSRRRDDDPPAGATREAQQTPAPGWIMLRRSAKRDWRAGRRRRDTRPAELRVRAGERTRARTADQSSRAESETEELNMGGTSRRRPVAPVGRTAKSVLAMILVAAGAAVVLAGSPASTIARRISSRRAALTRYSLVHGCYSLRAPKGGAPIAARRRAVPDAGGGARDLPALRAGTATT